ncbi:MAG: hypothetical protein KF833_17120 [Verrucomicrobiae bacterium]|nr:hypothetical protein [Verrucomicrobiae bacterium]
MNRRELELAALAAADRCLKTRGYTALDEVFREMGKPDARQWDECRQGQRDRDVSDRHPRSGRERIRN